VPSSFPDGVVTDRALRSFAKLLRPSDAPEDPTFPSDGVGDGIEPRTAAFFREFVDATLDGEQLRASMMRAQKQMQIFLMEYRFGLSEISTKVSILREQFDLTEDHSPIEHVKTRMKSLESLAEKVQRRGLDPDLGTIRGTIQDIAGMRITCPYVADVYLIAHALRRQEDLTVLQTKDYIASPKDNGYRSLHLIVEVPVFLAERTARVPVEIQLRTIAQDFWASTEHELRYKFDGVVPEHLSRAMSEIAGTTTALDEQMAAMRSSLS
jgi:putative GTP pyrophosphokinase